MLWYALSTVPDDLLDSATLDGAGPWTAFFRIALPMRLRAVAVAWLAALAVAWGEFGASVVAAPPGVPSLTIRVHGLIHYGVNDQVAGISLTVMAAVYALAFALAALARRAEPDGPATRCSRPLLFSTASLNSRSKSRVSSERGTRTQNLQWLRFQHPCYD